ncbi:unnamed protein product [Peniophora sp. CBMAI 1063]|nr:unnamed protein product [Peniophora sp. CBMAI 1063]
MSSSMTLRRPIFLEDVQPRPRILRGWQRLRHRRASWLVECLAEFWAVFVYTYLGSGATAAYITGNILGTVNLGSYFSIALAYAVGVAFSLIMATPTSGGHINCGVTINLVVFQGFPKLKALRYIAAQLLGGYVACLLVYVQWYDTIKQSEAVLAAAGTLESTMFTGSGPAGILTFFAPAGANLGRVFLNELVTDFFIGMVIWTAIDPTSFAMTPAVAPWAIGLGFGIAIWCFGPCGLGANTARDVPGRLAALTLWGARAGGGPFAAISALTNIVSYGCAYVFYELVLKDSSRALTSAHKEVIAARVMQNEYLEGRDRTGDASPKPSSFSEKQSDSCSDTAATWV